jgi:hypothetical protein
MNFSEYKQISKFGRKKVQSDAGSILAHDLVLGAFWPTHAVGETSRLGQHGAQLANPGGLANLCSRHGARARALHSHRAWRWCGGGTMALELCDRWRECEGSSESAPGMVAG